MEKRGSIIGGIILIAVGLVFLAANMIPGAATFLNIGRQWPLIVIGVGGLFMVGAILGVPSLAVPGSIIGGIGALLYYQNLTGDWESWAYAWTLIPGFVGVGIIITHLLDGNRKQGFAAGMRLIIISLALFAAFGLFFSGWIGIGLLWPVALIGLGILLLLRNILR